LKAESLPALGAPDTQHLCFLGASSQTPRANQISEVTLRKGPHRWLSCFSLQYCSLAPNTQHVVMLSHDTTLAQTVLGQ